MTDERMNLPSASGYSRLLHCPGSWRLEQQSPVAEETPEMASGTKIHAWLAGELPDEALTLQEMGTATMCRELEHRAIDAWKQICGIAGDVTTIREERMYLHEGFAPIFSGKPDLVLISRERREALILDYKTGFGEQQDSCENDQLRALSVLLRHETPDIVAVTVGIIQPGAGMHVQLSTFEASHIDDAESELRAALKRAMEPDAPTVLGNHCKFCAAKAICDKQQRNLERVERLHIGTYVDRQELLSNDRLAELLDACGQAERMIGNIRAEAKRRLEAGESVPGWRLVDGAARRTVTDAKTLAETLLIHLGITHQEIVERCASIKVSDLDVLIRQKTGMKVKDVKAWQAEYLQGTLEIKQSDKKLERYNGKDHS